MSSRVTNMAIRLIALIALCVQLAVSSAHVHPKPHQAFDDASSHTVEAAQDHPPLTAQDEDDHDCPTCHAMSLIASAVVPTPPQISRPALRRLHTQPLSLVQIAPFETERNFQARAPPSAEGV